MNAHRGTERTLHATLSGSSEPIWGWRWQSPGLHHYQWQDLVSPLWARVKTAVHEVATCEFSIHEEVHTGQVTCSVFRNRKGVSLPDFLELKQSTLTATSPHWLSWRLEHLESGQRSWQPFSCNMTTVDTRPVWRLWNILPLLVGPSCHTHHIARIWCLLTSTSSSWWKMDCMGNIFLAMTPSYLLWYSGSAPLVQIFTSAACRLLFIAGKNA